MKVSLNTVKRFTPVELDTASLVELINQRLGGVEEVTDFGSRYDGAVIVKVMSCHKHENADKLNVCMVDDGSGELTQVVCGAPNVREGMLAVWLKPGSTVPSTAEDSEPFVLGARELRGVMSNGMLASPKELGLGDSHDGILELDPATPGKVITPGTPFAHAFELDDVIIDIENKMFTHRPDLFGQLGVAREIAGIQHHQFKSPDWYRTETKVADAPSQTANPDLNVFNDDYDKVPRFTAAIIKDIAIKPSPLWLQAELVRMGGKPINNVVDATNYVMLMTAQPTHAYDYSKVANHTIGARMARDDETVALLNGKSYKLTPEDIVIADGNGPIGLAGIMGGGESEVSDDTTTIIVEVANFDMYTVRKSSMRHGIFTDALTRFNKGQSPLQNGVVLNYLVELIEQVAGGTLDGPVVDLHKDLPRDVLQAVSVHFINARLGLALTAQEVEKLLGNVEFSICDGCSSTDHTEDTIHYAVPFWRTDIELAEDIVEEVGRLYGLDRLPKVLPRRSIQAAPLNQLIARKRSVRETLARFGANEVLTYSFVHERLMQRIGQDSQYAYRLTNALSPELQYYRTGLMPSLLDKIHANAKMGYDTFALFEIGKAHIKDEMDGAEPAVPREYNRISLTFTDTSKEAGAAYYCAQLYLNEIIDRDQVKLVPMSTMDQPEDISIRQMVSGYEPARSAVLVMDDTVRGVVGEYTAEVRKAFKLPGATAGFEIDLEVASAGQSEYTPLSRFPSVSQDVSIRTKKTTFDQVEAIIRSIAASQPSHIRVHYEPMAIYQPESGEEITTTFRLKVSSTESTLTSGDVSAIVAAIGKAAESAFGGAIV